MLRRVRSTKLSPVGRGWFWMDDRRGIPSDLFFSADVLRLFDFLFLNFQNFHNFQNNCQKLFSIDTSIRNANSFY